MILKYFFKLREKYKSRFRSKLLLWLKKREFKDDPSFNLNLVNTAFVDRPTDTGGDAEIIQRIVRAYNKAKLVQQSKGPSFNVSNEWLPIYEQHFGNFISALQKENISELEPIFSNFMRNECSNGLHGLPLDMNKAFFGPKIKKHNKLRFLVDCIHRFNLWKNLNANTHQIKDLASPQIGNPYGLTIENIFIRAGSDYQHYYATLLQRLSRQKSHSIIVELGGGYGGLAYYYARDNTDTTFIDFDLPEALALASYYLIKAFPDKQIKLFGEIDLADAELNKYDIILLPSFEITKLKNNSVDVLFNSYSLAEMSQDTIRTYIDEFLRIGRDYILHVNHNKNSVVVADDFGIAPDQYDLIYKIPALWNGGRTLVVDEYEYLYKKIQAHN